VRSADRRDAAGPAGGAEAKPTNPSDARALPATFLVSSGAGGGLGGFAAGRLVGVSYTVPEIPCPRNSPKFPRRRQDKKLGPIDAVLPERTPPVWC
jgi:hypothetical protein